MRRLCKKKMMTDILKTINDFKIGEPSLLATCLYIMIPKESVDYLAIATDYDKTTAEILQGLNTVGFFE